MSRGEQGRSDETAAAAPLRIDVLRGGPTDEELAAVIAVVSQAYEHEASSAVAADDPRRSVWIATGRSLQTAPRRDLGW